MAAATHRSPRRQPGGGRAIRTSTPNKSSALAETPDGAPGEAGPVDAGPAAGAPELLVRFDGVERAAHWTTATLFLMLIATGAALYIPALVGLVGRRTLVLRIHVDAGLALPVPLLISLAGAWGKGLRDDLRRINRWTYWDRRWFRQLLKGETTKGLPVGKFNAGQKLNAAFVGGVIIIMLMTGSVMRWAYFFPLSWRTGATFVHDLVAYMLVAVVIGHVGMALAHPRALWSMVTGKVSRSWAKQHAPEWLKELERSRSD
jgi:formate dehydrogenase subunit gamma